MIGAVLALAVFVGCGGGGTAATPTPGSAAVQCGAAGGGTAVNIQDFSFSPGSLAVAVDGAGTWSNKDGTSHTVSFDNGPDCGTVAAGGSLNVLFTVAGEYKYHCNIHRSMTATVLVQ
jgi:plastocyanin